MTKNVLKFTLAVLLAGGIGGCATEKETANPVGETAEVLPVVHVEPARGKLNVYTSMARAVKYNVDVTDKNIHKKIFSSETDANPKEEIRRAMNVKTGGENQLYDAVRVLDFAVVYAISNLSENKVYVDNNIYAKSAQQLAMAAIKGHKDALFSIRKIKEIDRLTAKENKELKRLNDKLSRNGMLSSEDLELKKGIEVALYKLGQLKAYLQSGIEAYGSLVKVEREKMQPEGRHFYELEDFDKRNALATFQHAAVNNRSEFNVMRDEGYRYSEKEVMQNAIRLYPEIETLEINGYEVKDALYVDSLQMRAGKIADHLVDTVSAYKKAEKPEDKMRLKAAAYEELGVAVLAQAELDYNIVRMADLDYVAAEEKIHAQRRELKELERRRNLSGAEKVELLNRQIAFMETELRLSQIEAERAVALRGLYFHSGLNPFNKKLMQAKVSGIEESLKVSFNKDMIEMLARADVKQKAQEHPDNQWSKGDDWLEKLVDGQPEKKNTPINVPQKPAGDFDPYVGERYNKLKTMQLGSYRERKNADIEWSMLRELYPEFTAYKPRVESALLKGKKIYRLVIKSENGGFMEMCNKLRSDRIECILR